MDPAQRPLGLHHIGIAVPSIAEALPHWTEGLGLVLHAVDDVPTEGVRVAVLMCGTTRIELVEPMGPETPVAKFLQKRGPGVHHLAFHVKNGQQKLDQLAAAGAPTLVKSPGPGAHGCKVAFVHPKYLNGVMAELVEDPHHG